MTGLSLIQNITIYALPLLFAITLHEVAHGWVASLFGDQTARLSGRLTLNPIKHIDPFGTVIFPLLMAVLTHFSFIFGWAKPVPVDARNMRNPRWNMLFVALAGPVSNLLMAFAWAGIAKLGIMIEQSGSGWIGIPLNYMGFAGILINLVLMVLNLIPLPPLDGGKVLLSLLPKRIAYYVSQVEGYSFLILIILIMTNGLRFLMPIVSFLFYQIASLFNLT